MGDVPDSTSLGGTNLAASCSLFRYTITNRSTDKDDYTVVEDRTVDWFIQTFLKRGVKGGDKDGSGIIGAVFKPHSHLEQKNVQSVTALILDVDGKFKKDGKLVVEPVDPDWFISQLPWRGIAHTSYTHTPEHPRFRVILPLAHEITPEQHRRLWYWIFERVQRKCDPACKNADRMFYLARAPKESFDQNWPWVRELRGKPLSIEDVPADFQLPQVAGLVKQGRKVGMYFAAPDTRFMHTDGHKLLDALMKTPLVEWALERPSDVSREVWRGIATNLAAISLECPNDEELYEACLQAFHTISEADGNRYSPGDTTRVYKDALKSAGTCGPMTFSRMAESGAPDEVCKTDQKTPIGQARKKTLRETPRSKEAPSGPETKTAAAGADPSPTQSASPSATTSLLGDPDDDEKNPEDDVIFNHPADGFLFDATLDKYLMKDDKGAWDTAKPISLQALNQMLLGWGLALPKGRDGYRSRILTVNARGALFDTPQQTRVLKDGVWFFNTYRPSTLPRVAGNWDLIRAVLLNLVGNDTKALEWLLDWLAAPLQSLVNKGKAFKMGTAPVFRGDEGSGKGTLHLIMTAIYGASNVGLLSQDALDSKFHGELVDKLFVTANEVISTTNRSEEVANKLKMWVTDPEIPIEAKFADTRTAPNYFNITFNSNADRPVIVPKNDRRYPVFKSKKLDGFLSQALYTDILGPKLQVSAFFDHLMTRQTSIKYGDLYETEARKELQRMSMSSAEQFMAHVKEEAWHAVAEPWRGGGNPNNPRMATTNDCGVITSTLQDVYSDWCNRNGLRKCNPNKVVAALRDMFPEIHQDVVKVGGLARRVWYGLPMHPNGIVLEFPKKADDTAPPMPEGDGADFQAQA